MNSEDQTDALVERAAGLFYDAGISWARTEGMDVEDCLAWADLRPELRAEYIESMRSVIPLVRDSVLAEVQALIRDETTASGHKAVEMTTGCACPGPKAHWHSCAACGDCWPCETASLVDLVGALRTSAGGDSSG